MNESTKLEFIVDPEASSDARFRVDFYATRFDDIEEEYVPILVRSLAASTMAQLIRKIDLEVLVNA